MSADDHTQNIIKADKPNFQLIAEPDGKITVRSNSFEGNRTVLRGRQLTVVWSEGKCLVTIAPIPTSSPPVRQEPSEAPPEERDIDTA